MAQLLSYIAPAAPATRRPANGNEPHLRPEIGFTPAWFRQHLSLDFGRRWHEDVAYRQSAVVAMRQLLRDRFPGSGIGAAGDESTPPDLLTGVYGAVSVAVMLGCQPQWDEANWPTVQCPPLSPDDVMRLEVPDLDTNPHFQSLMRQMDEIEQLGHQPVGFVNWQGMINNAQRLRGQDIFMDLHEDPEMCHHLFSIICDTMIRAIQRVHERQRRGGVDYRFATVSNCTVNMISPDHYRRFLLPYDQRIAARFESIGIHNCAWKADPYLDDYASIDNVGYIDMGLASDLPRARRLFPHARRALMYTPMDLANKTEEAVREDFQRICEEYGPCDLVIADVEAGTPDERVLFALQTCRELS